MKKILVSALLVGACASLTAGPAVSKTYKAVCTEDGAKFSAKRTAINASAGLGVVVAAQWLNAKSPVGFYMTKEEEGKKTCALRRIRCWKN